MEALTRFRNVGYDLLNVSEKSFEDDFFQFRSTIKELERRLGSVLTRGFDDCGSIYSAFKLVESFEGLLDREIIHRDLEKKQSQLLRFVSSCCERFQITLQWMCIGFLVVLLVETSLSCACV